MIVDCSENTKFSFRWALTEPFSHYFWWRWWAFSVTRACCFCHLAMLVDRSKCCFFVVMFVHATRTDFSDTSQTWSRTQCSEHQDDGAHVHLFSQAVSEKNTKRRKCPVGSDQMVKCTLFVLVIICGWYQFVFCCSWHMYSNASFFFSLFLLLWITETVPCELSVIWVLQDCSNAHLHFSWIESQGSWGGWHPRS